ncbi:Coq4 family protein [Streptomyces sp. NPDC101225]|uniref:Coq4 family protein n=1 Tax=Streptomyces sp. NPDC101225 TaxID=3366135 RepID=UPI00380A44C9
MYQPAPHDLDALLMLPEGTLGHAYARHMRDNGLAPQFYEPVEVTSDALYMRDRLMQTHDLVHTLTGYDTSILDETAITGFYFGQQDRYHPDGGGILMIHSVIQESAVFLHAALKNPEDARLQIRAFIEGYSRGYAAKPFLSFRLEELFDQPIEAVRESIGIVPRAVPGSVSASDGSR